jgi:RNA polymerase-binding transcription factor
MDSDEDIKQRLLALRKHTRDRLHALDADVHHTKEPVEKDFAEQATQRENDDVLHSLDEEAKQTLIRIDNALQRLQAGEYGICIRCGVEIPQPRLKVVPYAELCVACADKSTR